MYDRKNTNKTNKYLFFNVQCHARRNKMFGNRGYPLYVIY